MGWLDRLLHLPYEALFHTGQGIDNVKSHGRAKVNEASAWKKRQEEEYARKAAERERINKDLARLRNPSNFPGMSGEQRAQQIAQLSTQIPGRFDVFSTRPVVKGITTIAGFPFHLGWRALKGGASASSTALNAALRAGGAIAPRVTPGSNTILIFIAILYHLWIAANPVMSLTSKISLNILMLFITIFFIFDPSERNGDSYRVLFILILILEIMIPFLANNVALLQKLDWVQLYLSNSFIIWTWIYYAVFIRGRDIGGFTKLCRIILFLFWLGIIASFIMTSFVDFSDVELKTASTDQRMAFWTIWEKSKEGWNTIFSSITRTAQTVQDTVTMRMKEATGEYYYGVVEESEDQKIGVFIENLKPSQKKYQEYEPVNVYATLRAYTLDDTLDVTVGCYAGRDDKPIQGKIYPDDSFNVYNLQEEELDCSFERLPLGTNRMTFTADFNFETIGYLKRYFADRDAIVAAARENIDLLSQYQILDKNPVARYTNGPVRIGMGPEQALIGISETYDVKPRLALTLDSGWDGTIKQLNEVVLIIPKEMSLDTEECSDRGWTDYTTEACVASEVKWKSSVYRDCDADESCIGEFCASQYENYHAYMLDISSDSRYKNIEDYVTLSCRLNIDDVAGLLGATPIATNYFYVKARYDYVLREQTGVTVEAEKNLASDGKTAKESVPSFTLQQRDRQLQYIFYNYGGKLFDAQTTYGTPVCYQAALIAQISGGDPYYFDSDRHGLFGLTTAMMSWTGYSGVDYYDVGRNIDLGNTWLTKMKKEENLGFDEQLTKQYYAGLFTQNKEENEDKDSADLGRFVSVIDTYMTTCKEQHLDESIIASASDDISVVEDALRQGELRGVLTANTSALVTYLSLTNEDTQLPATLHIDRDWTEYVPGTLTTGFDVVLEYANQEIYDLEVWLAADKFEWESFDSKVQNGHLLIQARYDVGMDILNWRAVDGFTINLDLQEDKEVELIHDFLYVEYTGTEIVFSVANDPEDKSVRTEICDLRWYSYASYASCGDSGFTDTDNLPGLIVRNIETNDNTFGTGFAHVQISWDNKKQFEEVLS